MYLGKLEKNTLKYIVDNLCDEAKEEMKYFFKNNCKKKALEYLKLIPKKNINVICLKETKEPVAIFGIIEQTQNTAGIFFLSTKNLKCGNMILFLKQSKKIIKNWEKKYKLLLDSAYSKNKLVIKWLKFLGFKLSKYKFSEFLIYYKGDINEY